MLEKYQKMLKKAKEKQAQNNSWFPPEMSLEFVQNLFEMLDVNKWLKFNATSEKQLEQIEKREKTITETLKKLCVPTYPIENT